MLQNTTIFKIGGGLVAAGGTTGAGIYYKDKIIEFFYDSVISVNDAGNDYLIVKANQIEENAKNLISGKNRNYNCAVTDKNEKIGCLITEIVFNDKKSVEISTVSALSFDTSKETKIFDKSKQDKYFKVQFEKEKMTSFNLKETNTLNVLGLNSDELVKFIPQLKIVSGKVETNNNFVFAFSKASATTDTADTFSNYKCTMDTEITEATECKVYKFATPQEESTTLESVDFGTNTLSEATQDSDIQDQKMHIIELINPKISTTITTWKDKTIAFKPYANSTVTTGKKTYTFTVKGRIFGDLKKSSNGIFIIEK